MSINRTPIANQGEIRVDLLSEAPGYDVREFTERNAKGHIISHSESGHHHILGGDCEVMERVDAPVGMRILTAIVREPTKLFQDAATPHETVSLEPGIYELRIKREYDPFAEQARRVAD